MLEFHPIANRFPVNEEGYGELLAGLRANGQQRAIALYEGKVWDGRLRAVGCDALGLEPRYRFLRKTDPIIFLLERHTRYGAPSSPERHAALEILRQIRREEWKAAARKQKSRWLAAARANFRSFSLRPKLCDVCGKYAEFCHAHHSLPLSLQFELGLEEPTHEHDWLCPTHHRWIHMLIGTYITDTRDGAFLDHVPEHHLDEWHLTEKLFMKGYGLFEKHGGTPYNGKTWALYQL